MSRSISARRSAHCGRAPARSKMSTLAMSLRRNRKRRAPMHGAHSTLPQAPSEGGRYGEVFDRGYKHYDGPRLGRNHARRALVGYSVKRAMGIKKSWTAKVIPIFLYVAVLIPVIISLGIRAFLPTAEVLQYSEYFGSIFIFLVEGVFAAMIAPELLSSDRQEKVLPLYFAR